VVSKDLDLTSEFKNRIDIAHTSFNITSKDNPLFCKKQYLYPGKIGRQESELGPKTLTEAWEYVKDPLNEKYINPLDFTLFICHDYTKIYD
jgi:hypothetical protein